MKYAFFLALATLAVFSSCKKKSNDTPDPVNPTPGSNRVDLISRSWKMTYFFSHTPVPDPEPGHVPFTNLLDSLPACSQDDVLNLLRNGIYTITEGEIRCRPSDPTTAESGRWTFLSGEGAIRRFRLSDRDTVYNLTSDIDSLTEGRLRLSSNMVINGQTYRVSAGYRRQ